MSLASTLHITVPRTARYSLLGTLGSAVRDVWIVCHGYGQLAAPFAESFAPVVDPSRVIVAPEALSRFYTDTALPHTPMSAIGASWMTREDRDAEISDIVTYLDAVYQRVFELLAPHGVSRERVCVHALGFSQGVPTVVRWVARGASVVDHVVAWGSPAPQDVNLQAVHERAPAFRLDVVYGEADRFMTPGVLGAQRALLDASGVPYRVRTFAGGHVLDGATLRDVVEGA